MFCGLDGKAPCFGKPLEQLLCRESANNDELLAANAGQLHFGIALTLRSFARFGDVVSTDSGKTYALRRVA